MTDIRFRAAIQHYPSLVAISGSRTRVGRRPVPCKRWSLRVSARSTQEQRPLPADETKESETDGSTICGSQRSEG